MSRFKSVHCLTSVHTLALYFQQVGRLVTSSLARHGGLQPRHCLASVEIQTPETDQPVICPKKYFKSIKNLSFLSSLGGNSPLMDPVLGGGRDRRLSWWALMETESLTVKCPAKITGKYLHTAPVHKKIFALSLHKNIEHINWKLINIFIKWWTDKLDMDRDWNIHE